MKSIHGLPAILLVVVAVNCFALVFMTNTQSSFLDNKRALSELDNQKVYRFDDPATAYQILEKLDIFEQLPATEQQLNTTFARSFMGLIPDADYCTI